jgi:hypothetical protein
MSLLDRDVSERRRMVTAGFTLFHLRLLQKHVMCGPSGT